MIKKLIVFLLACCLLISSAHAEPRQWQREGSTVLYTMEDYAADLPEDLRRALAASAFAQAPVLCAAQVKGESTRQSNNTTSIALVAVEHDGSTLLLSVDHRGSVTAIARNFNAGQDFYLTAQLPPYTNENPYAAAPYIFIVSGNRWVGLTLGTLQIGISFAYHADGAGDVICTGGAVSCYEATHFSYPQNGGHFHYPAVSFSPWDWNILTWPCTHTEMLALEQRQPFNASLVYAFGCNLRTQATSKSASLGQLCSYVPVRLTGNTKPGTQLPWYEIEIGQTRAWVSANYLELYQPTSGISEYGWVYTSERYRLTASTAISEVCRPKREISLYETGSSSAVLQTLTPEDVLTIAAESSAMYLVCISTHQPGRMIPDGIYGWVKKSDVITASNPVQLAFN